MSARSGGLESEVAASGSVRPVGIRTITAYDTPVTERSPLGMAVGCVVTAGVFGAVHVHQVCGELARFGRARGRMPFPFISVNVGAMTLAWIAGAIAWALVVAATATYVRDVLDGVREVGAGDITMFTTFAILLAPMVLVVAGTTRRIRTAQHLAGVEGPLASPARTTIAATAFPPLGNLLLQRELNRAWEAYR
jgi:hypothetical protein